MKSFFLSPYSLMLWSSMRRHTTSFRLLSNLRYPPPKPSLLWNPPPTHSLQRGELLSHIPGHRSGHVCQRAEPPWIKGSAWMHCASPFSFVCCCGDALTMPWPCTLLGRKMILRKSWVELGAVGKGQTEVVENHILFLIFSIPPFFPQASYCFLFCTQ